MTFVASVQRLWKQKLLKKLLTAEGVWSELVLEVFSVVPFGSNYKEAAL